MNRASYSPGPATGAEVQKEGNDWTLVLVRELRHSPAKVWKALTDPDQLKQWAPFETDRNLGTEGTAILSTVGANFVSETKVTRGRSADLGSTVCAFLSVSSFCSAFFLRASFTSCRWYS